MFHELLERLHRLATMERTVDAIRAAFVFAVTLAVMPVARRWVRSLVEHRGGLQHAVLAGRLTYWVIFLLGLTTAVRELGFKLSVVLGAAGVFSVAIGFASQTTLSNIISGFFLFGDRPFVMGDTVEVEGIVGEVLSINLMSTAIRTPDGRFVRVPNETLIKTKLTNLTRFSERRLEVTVTVANDEDYAAVREQALELARAQPLCLKEPVPQVFISSFGETSFVIQIWLWTKTADLQPLRTSFNEALHQALAGVRRTALGPFSSDLLANQRNPPA
jgi:small-conductance mechanosensitive channel